MKEITPLRARPFYVPHMHLGILAQIKCGYDAEKVKRSIYKAEIGSHGIGCGPAQGMTPEWMFVPCAFLCRKQDETEKLTHSSE